MQKIILLLIPLSMFASGQTLTSFEHMSINHFKNRPSLKLNKQRLMHKLHMVNEQEAEHIVKKLVGEDILSMELTHVKNYLIYKITTRKHTLVINALDGNIIQKN